LFTWILLNFKQKIVAIFGIKFLILHMVVFILCILYYGITLVYEKIFFFSNKLFYITGILQQCYHYYINFSMLYA